MHTHHLLLYGYNVYDCKSKRLRRRKHKFLTVTCKFWASAQVNFPPQIPSLTPRTIKRVSVCSEFKQLSACTVLVSIDLMPEEL
jgi:hypothetical protein